MKTQPLHRGAWANSEPMVYMSCSGPCEQGRKPCQTPAACEISPYDVESQAPWLTALIAGAAILGTIVVSVIFAMVTV